MMNESWEPPKRARKAVDRFVAEPASYRTAGDFVKPEKAEETAKNSGKERVRQDKGRRIPHQSPTRDYEPLRCRPQDLEGKRIKVYWKREKEWFFGVVSAYEPDYEPEHSFTITYDDGETEEGMFYDSFWVNDENDQRPYEIISKVTKQKAPSPVEKPPAVHEPAADSRPAAVLKPVAELKCAPPAAPLLLRRPTQQNLTLPEPPPISPGVMSKFQEVMQNHTARSAAASQGSLGSSEEQKRPETPSVVKGVPVPGQRSQATPLAAPSGLGISRAPLATARKPKPIANFIPEWGAQQRPAQPSKQLFMKLQPPPSSSEAAAPAPEPVAAIASNSAPAAGVEPASASKREAATTPWPEAASAQAPDSQAAASVASTEVENPAAQLPENGVKEGSTRKGAAERAEELTPASVDNTAVPEPEDGAEQPHKRGRPSAEDNAEQRPPPAKRRRRLRKAGEQEAHKRDTDATADVHMEDTQAEQGKPLQAATQPAAEAEIRATATHKKQPSQNGYGTLAADNDFLSKKKPINRQQSNGSTRKSGAQRMKKTALLPDHINGASDTHSADAQQRILSGAEASTSSPSAAYDARAAAQPPRSRAAAAHSKLGPQARASNAETPASQAPVAPPVEGPSPTAQGSQEPKPAQLRRDPSLGTPKSAEGRGRQLEAPNGSVQSPVQGSSPSMPATQSAKAAGNPQVTKLVTVLPSRLSPAYTPSLRPPSHTPGGSAGRAQRSTLVGGREAVTRILGSPAGASGRLSDDDETAEETKEDLEAARRRKAQDSIVARVEHAIKTLTRTKDSIRAATLLAVQAAQRDATARVIRFILGRIEKEEAGPKRVDLLYLADSILQNCRNSKLEGCGPDSKGAQAFPRVIAAALPALITAVAEDPVGAEKAEKVLSLWTKRALLPSAVLLPEAERLQERLQAHSKAAAARETEKAAAQSSRAADLTNGSKILRIGPEAGGGALMELKQEEDDDWDDDQAAPLPTLPQAEENHRAPWQRTGGTDVAVGEAPGSPEGSPWHQGVSPASSGYNPMSPALPSREGEGTPQRINTAHGGQWNQPGYKAGAYEPAVQHGGYGVPPPQPPPLSSWPHAQMAALPPTLQAQHPAYLPQMQAAAPVPQHLQSADGQQPPAAGSVAVAPQPVEWEPEEAWDRDTEPVPPGLEDARGKNLRQGSQEPLYSPAGMLQHNGREFAANPSRLAAVATEPARLLDEYDDLYTGGGGGLHLRLHWPPPSEQFPALFPQPTVMTPAAPAAQPPHYAVQAVRAALYADASGQAGQQREEELPPLPEEDPPPLPPDDDEFEDDENFQPPLPSEPPPSTPAKVQDVDMDITG